ncbi:MAG TPA: YjbQ family protein [Anaerolineae bacterium]|nr:YjbQ family protein [Anaerolineae bacterium]
MFKEIEVKSTKRHDWINILDEVKTIVKESDVAEGICVVYNPHTTAGLFVNSYLDPNTPEDILQEWDRIIPTRYDFNHQFDTPSDASGHVKSAMMGIECAFIVHKGELVVGHSQGIVLAEFDGPRDRRVFVKVIKG